MCFKSGRPSMVLSVSPPDLLMVHLETLISSVGSMLPCKDRFRVVSFLEVLLLSEELGSFVSIR